MARGKKIDTWRYSERGIVLDIPVYMHKEALTYSDQAKHSFRVDIANPKISIWDTDIEKLKADVFAEVRRLATIEWEYFLAVRTDGGCERLATFTDSGSKRPRLNATFHLDVWRIKIGTLHDGTKVHVDLRYDNEPRRDGLPRVDVSGEDEMNHRYCSDPNAIIPDTPENRAALTELCRAMMAVKDNLRRFLFPDQIELTLAKVLETKALPAPPAAEMDLS